MYLPKHFEEPRAEVMHELIRARPLATLVTVSANGLNANHIPLHLTTSPAPFGTLRGHVARTNPIVGEPRNDIESLAIFQGPDAYISPSWYASKKESGKVVPTWNYVVVHAYGVLRLVDDPAWLLAQIEALTHQNEASLPEPWKVSDAPREYVEQRLKAIVGVEMVITRLIGKWKLNQNQPADNRTSVVAGLQSVGSDETTAMADLVAARADSIR